MRTKLHILLLEDDVADAGLIEHELDAAGFAFRLTRIQTEVELRDQLTGTPPDLVISDHGLPSFDGFKALEIVRDTFPDLPFIFVSGSNDQGMVAHMHEEGATDYVYKNDLMDLREAVRTALSDAIPKVAGTPLMRKAAPAAEPAASPLPRQLRFCPACLRARDEDSAVIQLEDFLRRHANVTVLHAPCEVCAREA